MCNPNGQFLLLDSAWAGHDGQPSATDFHAADINDRIFLFELTAGQFPRREDGDDVLHSGNGAERLVGQDPIVADHTDDRSFLAFREMRRQPQFFKAIHDMLDHGFGRFGFQHDDHGAILSFRCLRSQH